MRARPAGGERGRFLRLALWVVAAAVAAPAVGYLPPATAILKRVAQRRAELGLSSLEARGTLTFAAGAARRLATGGAASSAPGEVAIPAILQLKAPGRCRLELAPPGAPAADHPALWARGPRVAGRRGLDEVASARALLEAVCALLADRGSGAEPERGLAQRLADRGVDLREVALGRLGTRVAWVIGGRPQQERPQAWVDKQTYLPVRLVGSGPGGRDVRLLEFGAGSGGESFPRSVEVWSAGQLEARFTTEKVTPNPRLPDSLFP